MVDSFVYQFLDVDREPAAERASGGTGAWAIAGAALNRIVSGFSQEVDYVFSLGWLPFPLPPLAAPGRSPARPATRRCRMSLAAASGTAVTAADGVGHCRTARRPGNKCRRPTPPDNPGLTGRPRRKTIPDRSAAGDVRSRPQHHHDHPTPDNSAPTVPAPTRIDHGSTKSTTASGRSGRGDGSGGAGVATRRTTVTPRLRQRGLSDGAGSDDGVNPVTRRIRPAPTVPPTPGYSSDPETPDPAAPNSASTDTAADSAADSTGSGSSTGGASAVN